MNKYFKVRQDTTAEEHCVQLKLLNEVENEYIYVLPAQAVEGTTEFGPLTPAPNSSPAPLDTVQVLPKSSKDDSIRRNCSQHPQETEDTYIALCLVHFLRSSGHLLYSNFTQKC